MDSFKNKLDKFWSNRDLINDYKAELTGIENKSFIWILNDNILYVQITYVLCNFKGTEATACAFVKNVFALLCFASINL